MRKEMAPGLTTVSPSLMLAPSKYATNLGRALKGFKSKEHIFWTLNFLFCLQWVALAVRVNNRSAWLLENLLVFALVVPVIIGYRKGHLSSKAYFLIFLFASLHNLGAHYTYSLVPYDKWLESVSGITFNSMFGWSRNHYDRFIHFLFGLLLFFPFQELVNRFVSVKEKWVGLICMMILISASTLYELLEWAAAVIFSDGAGPEYVGTQGDVWDAQKDQSLAILGGILAWGLHYLIRSSITKAGVNKDCNDHHCAKRPPPFIHQETGD